MTGPSGVSSPPPPEQPDRRPLVRRSTTPTRMGLGSLAAQHEENGGRAPAVGARHVVKGHGWPTIAARGKTARPVRSRSRSAPTILDLASRRDGNPRWSTPLAVEMGTHDPRPR